MKRLQDALRGLDRAWQQRSRREQAVLLLATAALAAATLDTLVARPLAAERARFAVQRRAAEQERALLRQDQVLRQARQAALDREEAALRQRIARADAEMAQIRQAVTPPAQMLERLRRISGQGSGLTLAGLAIEPAEPVFATAPAASASAPARATLYRLPVRVTLEGPYGALHDHLHALETDTPGLRWRSVELQSTAWPTLRLTLRVYTLGEQPTWPL